VSDIFLFLRCTFQSSLQSENERFDRLTRSTRWVFWTSRFALELCGIANTSNSTREKKEDTMRELTQKETEQIAGGGLFFALVTGAIYAASAITTHYKNNN